MKKTFTSFTLSLVIGLSMIGQIPTNGLLGYWPFNGNANDSSGNGNNGTVNKATLTTDRFGNSNSAYNFNGSSYIDFGNIHPTSVNKFSISIWFNTSSISSSPCLIENGLQNQCFDIYIGNNNTFIFTIAKSKTESNAITIPVGSNILNGWHHAVCISDSGTISVYFDGSLFGLQTGILGINPTNHLMAGYDQTGNNHWYKGSLDDIRIYNRILSVQEIQSLFYENICKQSITVTDTLIINANLTGFNPIAYQNNIKIYPNPTKSAITIDFGSNYNLLNTYTIKIVNSLNQTVYSSVINKQISTIDLKTWSGKGIYIVNLIDANSNTIESKKIVLQ